MYQCVKFNLNIKIKFSDWWAILNWSNFYALISQHTLKVDFSFKKLILCFQKNIAIISHRGMLLNLFSFSKWSWRFLRKWSRRQEEQGLSSQSILARGSVLEWQQGLIKQNSMRIGFSGKYYGSDFVVPFFLSPLFACSQVIMKKDELLNFCLPSQFIS